MSPLSIPHEDLICKDCGGQGKVISFVMSAYKGWRVRCSQCAKSWVVMKEDEECSDMDSHQDQ